MFPFKTAANFSKFTKYFTKEIGEELRVEHRLIGKDYAWEGMIPGEKTVGNIEIPARKASYRLHKWDTLLQKLLLLILRS